MKLIKNLTIWKCFNFRFKKDKNFSNTALESSDLTLSFPNIFGYRHGTQICWWSHWIFLTNMIFMFHYSHFMYNWLLWVPSWYPKFSYFKSIHSRLSIAVSNTSYDSQIQTYNDLNFNSFCETQHSLLQFSDFLKYRILSKWLNFKSL